MAKKTPKPAKKAKSSRPREAAPAPKAGRQPFKPTPNAQMIVRAAAGIGLRQQLICKLVFNPDGTNIDKKTLAKYFHEELQAGMATAHYNVGKSLYDQAVGIPKLNDEGKQTGWVTEPNTTAGIWFSKAQMGWREGIKLEVADIEAIIASVGGNVEGLRALRAAVGPGEAGSPD